MEFDTVLKRFLWFLIGLWLVLAVACLFLITLWTDEAWVLNGLRSTLEPIVKNLSTEVIFTSGGPFALANLAIERAFGSVVWIHRAFSLICLLSLLAIVYRFGARSGGAAIAGALAIAPLLSLTGTAEVGTLALGHAASCLLIVLGMLYWTRNDAGGIVRPLIGGVLFGLAAASRTEMVLGVAAVVAVGAFRPLSSGRLALRVPWSEMLMAVVALGVVAANMYLLRARSNVVSLEDHLSTAASASGLGGSFLMRLLDYPLMLNKMYILQSLTQIPLLMIASTLPFFFRSDDAAQRRFSILMIASAWTLTIGWIFRAPIPHLRYLWPALMCFAIPTGIAMARLYDLARREGRTSLALVCLIVAIGGVAGGLAGTTRSLVQGEGNLISFEWSREMGVDYFRRFQALRDQAAVIEYIKTEIPQDVKLYSVLPFKYQYLAHRPIIDTRSIYTKKAMEERAVMGGNPERKFLILPPELGHYYYLTPEGDEWYRSHARLVAEFGRHSVYEIQDEWPEDPELLWLYRTHYLRHPLSTRWFGMRGGFTPASRSGVEKIDAVVKEPALLNEAP